jgi:hypothetical protein
MTYLPLGLCIFISRGYMGGPSGGRGRGPPRFPGKKVSTPSEKAQLARTASRGAVNGGHAHSPSRPHDSWTDDDSPPPARLPLPLRCLRPPPQVRLSAWRPPAGDALWFTAYARHWTPSFLLPTGSPDRPRPHSSRRPPLSPGPLSKCSSRR